jgi:GNAT superfamily N-acetyltransferase
MFRQRLVDINRFLDAVLRTKPSIDSAKFPGLDTESGYTVGSVSPGRSAVCVKGALASEKRRAQFADIVANMFADDETPRQQQFEFTERMVQNWDYIMFIIDDRKDTMLSACNLCFNTTRDPAELYFDVYDVCTQREYGRQGLATALMKHVLLFARELQKQIPHRTLWLYLTVDTSKHGVVTAQKLVDMYTRLGYAKFDAPHVPSRSLVPMRCNANEKISHDIIG